MKLLQNLRIGTKLAVTSALTILIVGIMVYVQLSGGTEVSDEFERAIRQRTIAQIATGAKDSVRGMQVAVRDIMLSATSDDMEKALKSYADDKDSATKFVDSMMKLSINIENHERMNKLAGLIAEYGKGKDQIATIRNQVIRQEAKRISGNETSADLSAQLEKLEMEIRRIGKDVTLPINIEMDALSSKIVNVANKMGQDVSEEATAQSAFVAKVSMALGIAVALVLVLTTVLSVFMIAKPIRSLSVSMQELAEGNFGVVLPGLGRKDEVGDVAAAVERFKVKSAEKAREEAETKMMQDSAAAEQRKKDMRKLADDFEGAVGEIIETVSSASTQLEASAGTLSATAERAQELTIMVAAASEEASTNVASVASATEEMAASVAEISRQVQQSARIAGDAVAQADKTNEQIGRLAQTANRIGDVVDLINTIAGQTNLLALNATIEAARAGEAGRGFAVVASEVKALAEQTAKATGEISQQIGGMQTATADSVAAIKEIGGTIGHMSEIASTIAAAVEEQGAATQEISRNVQQAAQGTQQVTVNISDVQRGSTETGSASSQVFSSAKSLSVESSRLKLEVEKFLETVRAA